MELFPQGRLLAVIRASARAVILVAWALSALPSLAAVQDSTAPTPQIAAGQPVDWWFAFKFNGAAFPGCPAGAVPQCPFGGQPQNYRYWSQQFAFASSQQPSLQKGAQCIGDTTADPVGATFSQIYNGQFHYVLWNDQFKGDPRIGGCSGDCSSPWGHSKGALAWNDAGTGLVMQVTTPSWPASGSTQVPRKNDGNTLGCVNDDNVMFSQHFFALKLSKDDVVVLLKALANASVVTDPGDPQIVSNGGPPDIQELVGKLGVKSLSTTATIDKLSSGFRVISKPSQLHVPPWQMVSALLGGVPLRTASWWTTPTIGSSTPSTKIACWDDRLGTPGPVDIAASGQFEGTPFALTGGQSPDHNHAKIGVTASGITHYAIFGDMNQQGTLSGANCGSSQNGRGGLFFVLDVEPLFNDISNLLKGGSEPAE
jgi:hypothetical protein